MGKAQNMISLVKLAEKYDQESKVSFLFIGRGSEVKNLKSYANKKLSNIGRVLELLIIPPSTCNCFCK